MNPADRGLLENTRFNEYRGITENPTLDFGIVFAPTAAFGSIRGIVKDSNERGLARVKLTLLNSSTGETKTGTTNTFGHFSFAEIPIGEFYIIQAENKRFSFDPVSFQMIDDLDDLVIRPN